MGFAGKWDGVKLLTNITRNGAENWGDFGLITVSGAKKSSLRKDKDIRIKILSGLIGTTLMQESTI